MKLSAIIIICVASLAVVLSCKKESDFPLKEYQPKYQPNVAPCEIAETVYEVDSVFYGPDSYFPQAKFRIRFRYPVDTSFTYDNIEFAFNQLPVTGMYHLVTDIDSNAQNLNQIASIINVGSYNIRSCGPLSEFPNVYVENNDDELIISYCNIPDVGYWFDSNTLSYIKNYFLTLKVRKQY